MIGWIILAFFAGVLAGGLLVGFFAGAKMAEIEKMMDKTDD